MSRDPHSRILSDHESVKKLNIYFELQKGIVEGVVANLIDLVGLRNTRGLMRHTFGCVCEIVFRQVYRKKEEKTHPEYEWLHPMGCGPGHNKNRKPMKHQYFVSLHPHLSMCEEVLHPNPIPTMVDTFPMMVDCIPLNCETK